jgi:hypothetical protein
MDLFFVKFKKKETILMDISIYLYIEDQSERTSF